jgi:hypothetical protein
MSSLLTLDCAIHRRSEIGEKDLCSRRRRFHSHKKMYGAVEAEQLITMLIEDHTDVCLSLTYFSLTMYTP